MSKIVKYWCDSGANIHSCRKDQISLDDLGMTEEEWHEMTDDQRDNLMRDIALDRLDWGYTLEDEK